MQVSEKDKKLIQRYGHVASEDTVNSDCVEVFLFGGQKELKGLCIADPLVLRFGKGRDVFCIFFWAFTYSFVSLSDVEHFLFTGSLDLVRIKRFANGRSKRVNQGCKDLSLCDIYFLCGCMRSHNSSACHIYVMCVELGYNHFSWEKLVDSN